VHEHLALLLEQDVVHRAQDLGADFINSVSNFRL
jgi:hypothetical protein